MATAMPAASAKAAGEHSAADSYTQGVEARWLIAVAVSLGALLEVVDTSIVNVALDKMQNTLGATLSQISWVVSSYAVANVIVLPLTAWLGERFGKKRYFVFSLIGFTVSSVLCGFSANLTTLIIARTIQGLAGGGLLAKAQAILFETFPKNEQAQAQGLFGAIVIAGPAIGPTLGGYLTDTVGWRWIFFINVPVGIAAVLMCLTFLPADDAAHRNKAGVDWIAIGLLAAGLGFLQTMLEEGQEDDWFQSRFIIACFVIGVVSLVLFVWRELVVEHPVVDLRVLRYRSLWSGSILSVTVGMALYGTLFAVPIFAQVVLRYTSNQVGWMLFPGALASAFTMPIAAKLVDKYDARALLVVGSIILVFALSRLTALSPLTSGDELAGDLVIRSFGSVLIFLPLNMATLGPIPKEDVGKASGFFSLTRQLGGSTGVALLSVLLDQRQAFHRTVLVEKVATWDPKTLERVGAFTQAMLAKGFDRVDAHAKALALLDGSVSLQAAVLSFGDTFWATAAVIVVTLPLVLLLGKGGGKVEMGH